MNVGILTGGGDCPGLNAVIRAVARRSFEVQPANVTGVRLAVIGLIDPGPTSFMVDVDRAYVGRVERGEENVTINVVAAVAEALEVKVADLFVEPPAGAELPAALPPGRKPKNERA